MKHLGKWLTSHIDMQSDTLAFALVVTVIAVLFGVYQGFAYNIKNDQLQDLRLRNQAMAEQIKNDAAIIADLEAQLGK